MCMCRCTNVSKRCTGNDPIVFRVPSLPPLFSTVKASHKNSQTGLTAETLFSSLKTQGDTQIDNALLFISLCLCIWQLLKRDISRKKKEKIRNCNDLYVSLLCSWKMAKNDKWSNNLYTKMTHSMDIITIWYLISNIISANVCALCDMAEQRLQQVKRLDNNKQTISLRFKR